MDVKIAATALDYFGARCETEWLNRVGKAKRARQFSQQGYVTWDLSERLVRELRGFFAPEKRTLFSPSDCREDWFPVWNTWEDQAVQRLNDEGIYFAPPDPAAIIALEGFLTSIEKEVEQQFGYPWRVANVRAWSVRPGSTFGANAWHADGLSFYRRKFMFYLDPPDTCNGSLEMVDRKDAFHLLVSEAPQCVLFDSATLTQCVFAGHAAMFPRHIDDGIAEQLETQLYRDDVGNAPNSSQNKPTIPYKLLREIRRLPNSLKKIMGYQRESNEPPLSSQLHLMLGGGPAFEQRGWINLDPVGGRNNRFPFAFTDAAIFPIPSALIQTVYLNNPATLNREALAQTLREIRRVILDNGDLLIRMHDDSHIDADMLEGAGFRVKTTGTPNEMEQRFKNRLVAPHIEGPHLHCQPLS